MFINNNAASTVNLPYEMLDAIFTLFHSTELGICACVCKAWQQVADQKTFWAKFLTETQKSVDLELTRKQVFINLSKARFFRVFPEELIDALGGMEKVKNLPYLSFNEPRVSSSGLIQLSELNSPLTVGRVLTYYPMNKKDQPIDPSDISISRYTFLAIRFINREFDPRCEDKDVNVWITKEKLELIGISKNSKHRVIFGDNPTWRLISGGEVGGWPTRFPYADGMGNDFSKTIEYIGRLVKGEPCGVRDICSPIERSKLTPLGTSTVILN